MAHAREEKSAADRRTDEYLRQHGYSPTGQKIGKARKPRPLPKYFRTRKRRVG